MKPLILTLLLALTPVSLFPPSNIIVRTDELGICIGTVTFPAFWTILLCEDGSQWHVSWPNQ